jgi:phage gp46-like protein
MDISLLFQPDTKEGDIFMDGSELDSNYLLQTAVFISLFTDRRAEEGDESTEEDRRGWWGDTFLPIDGDKIGSRLWLLRRQKETEQVVALAKFYAEEALQWLIDDNVAESVNVEASILRRGVLLLEIEIVKPDGVQEINYEYVWSK